MSNKIHEFEFLILDYKVYFICTTYIHRGEYLLSSNPNPCLGKISSGERGREGDSGGVHSGQVTPPWLGLVQHDKDLGGRGACGWSVLPRNVNARLSS